MRPGATGSRAILLDALGTLVALQPPAPLLRLELAERFGLVLSAPKPSARSPPRSPTTAPISTRGATRRASRRSGAAAPRCCARRSRAAGLDLDALVDALLASLRFNAFAGRPARAQRRALARPAARRGEQLGRRRCTVSCAARARAAARRDPHLGGSRRAQAGAGDLRAGAGARRRRPRATRFTSATASRRMSPAPVPPESSRFLSAATADPGRPPAYVRSSPRLEHLAGVLS